MWWRCITARLRWRRRVFSIRFWTACPSRLKRCKWMAEVSSPRSSRRLASKKRVLRGACGVRSATRLKPAAAQLGENLQLYPPTPVADLPHPTGIYHPLERKPQKGKVSLIYWTSTPICRNLTLRVQLKIASRPSDVAVAHPFRGEALPSHEELAVQTGRDRMEPHETRYSSRLSPRHGALRLRP